MVPVLQFWNDTYLVMPGTHPTVVFRPREWRGSANCTLVPCPPFAQGNYLSPSEMAAEVSGYAPGTVAHIYLTSDGGGDLNSLYEMVENMSSHVRVVNADQAADLALQRHVAGAAAQESV